MTLKEIKTEIENGANWNGEVYGKNVGNRRNNVDLSIYLDGKYIAMGRISYEDAEEEKEEIIQFLTSTPEVTTSHKETNPTPKRVDYKEEDETECFTILDVRREAQILAMESMADNGMF